MEEGKSFTDKQRTSHGSSVFDREFDYFWSVFGLAAAEGEVNWNGQPTGSGCLTDASAIDKGFLWKNSSNVGRLISR